MRIFASSRFRQTLLETVLVLGVFLLAFVARLYKLHEPLADWHSFRQADTASVTREYVKHGIDILRPQYQDLSNIQSGEDNLAGWRMVEFPLVNAVTAFVLRSYADLNEVVVGRLFSIGASMISLFALWSVVRAIYGRLMAFTVASLFAFMPYSIFYSRVILPEPFLVMGVMLTAFCLTHWARVKKSFLSLHDIWLVAAGLSWAFSLLMKPMALFYAPVFLAIVWRWKRYSISDLCKLTAVFFAGMLPLFWWRSWIQQFPSGIPASDWLFNSNNIRFRPAWWRWLFGDRLGRMMFGHWATSFFAIGVIASLSQLEVPKVARQTWIKKILFGIHAFDRFIAKEGMVLFGLIGMLAYFVIIATGNVQHDYYQVMLVPIISLITGRGIVWLYRQAKNTWSRLVTVFGLAVMGTLSWYFAFYEIKGLYQINNPAIVSAGQAVQRLTPADARVIAPYFGDTSFLYQTSRRGWPIGFEIPQKITLGAQYYITTSQDDEANMLMRQYVVLEKTPEYILIDLQQPIATGETKVRK